MRRRVRWFREAIDDLVAHARFVAHDSPKSALMIASRVRAAGEALSEFAVGRPGRIVGTFERVLPDIPYTLVYPIDPGPESGGEIVSILRVVHQAQQWPPEVDG